MALVAAVAAEAATAAAAAAVAGLRRMRWQSSGSGGGEFLINNININKGKSTSTWGSPIISCSSSDWKKLYLMNQGYRNCTVGA